jgi:hypothetical protein
MRTRYAATPTRWRVLPRKDNRQSDRGVFCLSPRKGPNQILGRPAITGEFGECADDHINVEGVGLLLELVAPLEIDVLPPEFKNTPLPSD